MPAPVPDLFLYWAHPTAQVLVALLHRYDIELACHLVGTPPGDNAPEPEMMHALSRYDACHVAPEYGLQFPLLALWGQDRL